MKQFANVDFKHDGTAFRCPTDLSRSSGSLQRVLVIGQCTADHIRGFLLESGIHCDFVHIQSLMDPLFQPPQPIETYDLQIVFLPMDRIIPDYTYFPLSYADIDAEEKRFANAEKTTLDLLDVATRWLKSHKILTFIGNFLVPQQNPVGKLLPRYDLRNPCYFMEKINESLSRRVDGMDNAFVIDMDGVSSTFGKKYLTDDSIWSLSHGGFIQNIEYEHYESNRQDSQKRLEDLGPVTEYYSVRTDDGYRALRDEILSMYRIVRQVDAVKIVIIDLDDTAWRGIAAEEDNSRDFMTIGWPLGFVEALMLLKRRGILLAIISKNEHENAVGAWERNYGNIFPISNFVSVKANWLPKHENMRQILQETNLLAQNAVYIDDNPAERDIIQSMFPDIRVIGSNPYYTRRILLWSSETQVPFISGESSSRTESIKSVIQRESDRLSMDHDEFLRSLNIKIRCNVVLDSSDKYFKRCLELINKTNQFNTTGRRWTVEEVSSEINGGLKIYAFDVDDRFTQYGIVCVALVKENVVLQFVMSCRVIGLGVEMAALGVIMNSMREEGLNSAMGISQETEKNILSRDLYARAGFQATDKGMWNCDLNVEFALPTHMQLDMSC
ncbi:HAD-IIIC family phosphatase [Burkholderia cepacia]|uniref:HAD-IIIC family phosphatase n=1 Tax=Burkholderia cepacia TaxID=292 RepID=UPI001CF56050|nr:HAD-IIIC family phosphatase [Burkholderia cepacia]MCA8077987.1 HAD-IIIC family phosphatase [Burkholderia cepacia]